MSISSVFYDKSGNRYSSWINPSVSEWTYEIADEWTKCGAVVNKDIIIPIGDGYRYESDIDSN
ncbi:MAG: hypothetical protein Q8942_02405 [Bacillota bacterium]|nr:hypothetical protein [Bacillota bacterium]